MTKENKIIMLGWIEETFVSSNDRFEFSPYEIKHWMEDELGVYASEEEFTIAMNESDFKLNEDEGEKFFYIKLSRDAGPIVVNKYFPLSSMKWNDDYKEGMRNRLLK